MALVLAIDIRNTRTRIGLALDGRLVSQWAVPTDAAETADSAVACVLGFFDALARGLAPIEEGAPGAIDLPKRAFGGRGHPSVIPALTGVWADAARRLTDARPLTVGPA
ncbi:MAG: type III pantothenate kinase [Coriobacteriaceae bacterium]